MERISKSKCIEKPVTAIQLRVNKDKYYKNYFLITFVEYVMFWSVTVRINKPGLRSDRSIVSASLFVRLPVKTVLPIILVSLYVALSAELLYEKVSLLVAGFG